MDMIVHMRVTAADLLTGLNAALRAVEINPSQEKFKGVCFASGGDLLLSGTCGKRLHFYYIADAADHDLPVTRKIISYEDAKRIQDWLRTDPPTVVKVSLGPGYVRVDDIQLREREPRGVYPDYTPMLDSKKDGSPHILVDKKTLLDTLGTRGKSVRLKMGIRQLRLEDPEDRLQFDDVPVLKYDMGKAETFQSIVVNMTYLKDALKLCPTNEVMLYRVDLSTVPTLYVVPTTPGFLGIIAYMQDYQDQPAKGEDDENSDEAEGVSRKQDRPRLKRDRTLS